MRNFLKVGENVDVIPLMAQIAAKPHLWDENRLRTTHPGTAHFDVSDIWLWFNDVNDEAAVANDREVIAYRAWHELPQARSLVFGLMQRLDGVRLGRVLITRLPPGKRITPHVDAGAPATYFTRYQLALQSLAGAVFRIGEERVQFHTGECWQIDNTKEHEVINNSADDRIALIMDIRHG